MQSIVNHFPEVRKTIQMPKNAIKEVIDYELSRYACYLIVQNGDPRKKVIALGQTYFAIQTRFIIQDTEDYTMEKLLMILLKGKDYAIEKIF